MILGEIIDDGLFYEILYIIEQFIAKSFTENIRKL